MEEFGELSMESLGGGFADAENPFGGEEESSPFTQEENNVVEEVVDPEEIFKEDKTQDVVDKKEDKKDEVKTPESDKTDEGSSPKKSQFYSTALKALKDDGVLPDLDDEFIKGAESPEKFAEAIEAQVAARLDDSQKRIKAALDNGVEVNEIKKYENALTYLDGITDEAIEGDGDDAERLRGQIIYQDFINKGFKPERAQKEVTKAFNAGTDIEDAKIALESNKEHYSEEYQEALETAQKATAKAKRDKEIQVSEFKKKVLETEEPVGVKVDKVTRQKVYDNMVKPVHKDGDGRLLTTLQKYSKDNPNDAEYFFSLFYTMTDGFKNVDKFVGQKVKESTKSSLRELEHKLKNTPLTGDGTVDFGFGSDDKESFFGKDFKINLTS